MNVRVIGGGPAGLYAGLLLKKDHPDWDVAVFERNAPDATYGWGVVFSDRTLAGLREADVRTYTEITESFVNWEAIDVQIHDRLVRCDGHAFAGIGRRRLLRLLQDRCRELGVRLEFEVEIAGRDDERVAGADLLIAADGVNSRVREQAAEAYRPAVSLGRSRYIWFGADRTYDAFTFIFRQTEHGLFQVHAYPYDATMSTFIVECDQDTWQRAGLHEAGEDDSLAYCQDLFADHLGSHRLYSNFSRWLAFPTLTTRSWSTGNTVLLGDAAHTAHFSIGSGTRLALEDAIALAQAFEQHEQVADALRRYELRRRPRVEATQRAAAESRTYFEEVSRYHRFSPLQFTVHLLTRSGRISWDNLRQRDPHFVAEVERWYAASSCHASGAPARLIAPPPAFTPLRLGSLELPNRYVVQPSPVYDADAGVPSPGQAAGIERAAATGAAVVLTQPVAISAEGRITPGCPGLYRDDQLKVWQEIVESSQGARGARLALRLSHAGRRASTQPRSRGSDRPLERAGWTPLAPSPLRWGRHTNPPKEMTRDDLDAVVEQFALGAGRAAATGAGMLAIDLAHGYLLHSFLSPVANRRSDDFGGDLDGRMRFPLRVFEAVRREWPSPRPLVAEISATDALSGGSGIEEAIALSRALAAAGCDLLVVTAGDIAERSAPDYAYDTVARYCDVLRNESGLPAMSTAYMTTSNQANTLLAGGRADLCLFHPSRSTSV